MTKLNNIVFRTWLVTMAIVAFCLISSTVIYSYIYQKHVQEIYLSDFKDAIKSIEKRVIDDPLFVLENTDKFTSYDSHLFFFLEYDDQKAVFYNDFYNELPKNYLTQLLNRKDVKEIIHSGKDSVLLEEESDKESKNGSFILKINFFEHDGKRGVLYSYGDLSFLTKIDKKMTEWTAFIFVMLLILSVLFYQFLKYRIGTPLAKMRDIAFEYAKNDFSHQVSVNSKDELSQLALAMNKMGKSLEAIGMSTKQEKELLAHIVSSMTTGILYYNRDKTLLTSNPTGDEFLNRWRLNGQYHESEILPYVLDGKIDEVIEKRNGLSFELEIDDAYFTLNLVPLFSEAPCIVRGVLITIQNMTKERRLDTMRVDFINNVSHELRTPLVMIRGYSEAILDDVAETNEEKHEMAKIIWEESERMSRMVNEMLDLSRMEAGYIELTKTEVDLYEFFKDLLTRFSQLAESNHVRLELDIQDGMTSYWMDEDKMNQVLFNLINNAIRHTSLAEPIDGIRYVKLLIHLDEVMDELLIEIIDNGTGIPKQDLPFIFERFYKADKARVMNKQNQTGTGIGLSIVKNIVEEHDGYMEVQSEVNTKTRFIIHLPYLDEQDKHE